MPPQWAIEEQKRLAARAAIAFDSIATEAARRQQEEQVEADRQASLRESQAASSRAAAASSAQKAPAPKRRRVAADVGWDGWRSGENELEEAIRRGRWPDNVRVGKGHVRPFLQPPYARAIADGMYCPFDGGSPALGGLQQWRTAVGGLRGGNPCLQGRQYHHRGSWQLQ